MDDRMMLDGWCAIELATALDENGEEIEDVVIYQKSW